jgi:hypothetical protein
MYDLGQPDGRLFPILERVRKDQTLMLAIREESVNIYYRGGNLLQLKARGNDYQAHFDFRYDPSGQGKIDLPATIRERAEAGQWETAFQMLKRSMDEFFSVHNKPEREFQQLVARENNHSTISNESEYFISDIEFDETELGARFDLLAIRWEASRRMTGSSCRAILMEMKYGDGALDGNAGLLKHLQDIETLILDAGRYGKLLQTMESQFDQLGRLGLLKFNRSANVTRIHLNPGDPPEVVFILANHNPRSTKLKTILDDPAVEAYAHSGRFDLRFFISRFAGYGMHADCMLALDEFRKLL